MDKALTQRQLERTIVKLLVVLAVIATGIIYYIHSNAQFDRQHQVSVCLDHAPLGWDCQAHPTGYPGQP